MTVATIRGWPPRSTSVAAGSENVQVLDEEIGFRCPVVVGELCGDDILDVQWWWWLLVR